MKTIAGILYGLVGALVAFPIMILCSCFVTVMVGACLMSNMVINDEDL
jgi:hypothetical protein